MGRFALIATLMLTVAATMWLMPPGQLTLPGTNSTSAVAPRVSAKAVPPQANRPTATPPRGRSAAATPTPGAVTTPTPGNPTPTPAPAPTPTPGPTPTPSGVYVTQQCTLSATTVAPGQTLSATGSLWNNTTTALSLLEVVLAGRPPGGTNAGGPFDDFGPVSGAISVGAGATYTLRSSRTFTTSDPAGTWRCFLTYQTADSVYHDGLDTTFTVSSPAPTP